jgi:putative transposase
LIEVLSRVIRERGSPKYIRSENAPEFVSRALLECAVANELDPALIDPGTPSQNGTNESFNGKFRDECLGME